MQKSVSLFLVVAVFLLTIQTTFAQCTVNGKDVPCNEFFGTFGWIFVIIIIVLLAFGIFWLWMLIDCLQRDFKDKILWVIILIFASFLGAILYFFMVRQKKEIKTVRK